MTAQTKSQQELLDKHIIRISSEAHQQGALLTQADIAILLGESTKILRKLHAVEYGLPLTWA